MANHKKTGPFLIRDMPLELRVKIKILAASRKISMEALMIEMLTKAVNQQSAGEHNEQS